MTLRQEIDGPQAQQLELFPVDRYSKVAGFREELSPARIRDLEFLILKVSENTYLGGQKGGGITSSK